MFELVDIILRNANLTRVSLALLEEFALRETIYHMMLSILLA